MTRVEYLRQQIDEMRENGAEPEDIAQVVQDLNIEMAKAISSVPTDNLDKSGGKGQRRSKKNG